MIVEYKGSWSVTLGNYILPISKKFIWPASAFTVGLQIIYHFIQQYDPEIPGLSSLNGCITPQVPVAHNRHLVDASDSTKIF